LVFEDLLHRLIGSCVITFLPFKLQSVQVMLPQARSSLVVLKIWQMPAYVIIYM